MNFRVSAWKCAVVVSANVAVLLASAGCDRQPAPPLSMAAAAEVRPDEDTGKGPGYTYAISYPSLDPQWDALDKAIRGSAAVQKKDFLNASTADRDKSIDYTLDLNFAVARRTADFVSVTASGSSFVGSAHAMPILASFNLDLADGKLKTLSDLFADAQTGLQAVSAECRRQLEGRYEAKMRDDFGSEAAAQRAADIASMKREVENGTEATAGNFAVFLIDGLDTRAIGVTVIFPPHQVAPDADGLQQVEVPAKVFYDLLKPEYKDAFAIDTEASKPRAGVR